MPEPIDYRECTDCGPPGHVGFTFVAEVKGLSPTRCPRCNKETLLLKEPPAAVTDDLKARAALPTWFAKHVEKKGELNVHQFAWVLSRPEPVQKLFLQYPPGCVVRVRDTGKVGVNMGFVAGDSDFPTIVVGEIPGAPTNRRTEHLLTDVDVIGFWNGVDRDVVQSIIDAATPVQLKTAKPPANRNDPCTCGSGQKYKRCCGKLSTGDQKVSLQ